MQHKLTKWAQSCYDIELVVTTEDQEKSKEKILKNFQKDLELPGFRKGHAPMDKVEENVKPEYLAVGVYENLINSGLQELIKENPTIRFIWEPYDVNQKKATSTNSEQLTTNSKNEEKGDTIITLKLDIFPDVEVVNEDWKKHSLKKIDNAVKQEEIDDAMARLKKNYADYKDADAIALDTISKVALVYLDKDWAEVDKWHTYVGESEFGQKMSDDKDQKMSDDEKFFRETFLGKKKGDEFTIKYDTKKIPEVLLSKKPDPAKDGAGIKVAELKFTIQDVKQIILPEINDEMLEKLFGKESQVKNEKDLIGFIETSIAEQKFEQELMKQVEDLLNAVKGKNLKVEVPHTLIEEESKSRVANLEKRFGTKERVDEYFKQIGEEKTKQFMEDIKRASQESLEKFFVLQKLVQLLDLQINRENPGHLEIEKKLYEKLMK